MVGVGVYVGAGDGVMADIVASEGTCDGSGLFVAGGIGVAIVILPPPPSSLPLTPPGGKPVPDVGTGNGVSNSHGGMGQAGDGVGTGVSQ